MRKPAKYIILIMWSLLSINSYGAVCSSAPVGAQRYIAGNMQTCIGYWINLGDGVSTGDSCTAGEEGKQKYAWDNTIGANGMIYCNGTDWISLTVSVRGACTGAGRQRYNSGAQYCSGSTWYEMTTSASPPITLCGTIGIEASCNAESECYWDGGCLDCPCKR